jgi:hypothetical protein
LPLPLIEITKWAFGLANLLHDHASNKSRPRPPAIETREAGICSP